MAVFRIERTKDYKPDTEKPAELNIEKPNTQKQNTHGASTDSIPFRETAAAQLPERKGRDAMSVSEILHNKCRFDKRNHSIAKKCEQFYRPIKGNRQ